MDKMDSSSTDRQQPAGYTLADLAQVCGLSEVTLRQYVREGKLKADKSGRSWIVNPDEAVRFYYNHTHPESPSRCGRMGMVEVHPAGDDDTLIDFRFVPGEAFAEWDALDDPEILKRMGYSTDQVGMYHAWNDYVGNYVFENTGLLKRTDSPTMRLRFHTLPPNVAREIHEQCFTINAEPIYKVVDRFKRWFGQEPSQRELELLSALCSALCESQNHADHYIGPCKEVEHPARWTFEG